MLNEKKIYDKLEEIVGLMKDLQMSFFDRFPEDANEYRTSWSELYDMATDDYYTMCSVKHELNKLLEDIDEFVYDEEK